MIEVNEYVRLARNQGINKIIDKEDDRYILESEIADSYGDITWFLYECELKEDIVKHSKQLIDLIEIGDILKIKISEEWVEKQDTIKFIVVGQTYTITEIKECLENGLFKIIQILTKEQFDTNCYKVGGEDE